MKRPKVKCHLCNELISYNYIKPHYEKLHPDFDYNSYKDQLEEEKWKSLTENVDYVVCKICNHKSIRISRHLIVSHNITVEEYKEKYKAPVSSERYTNYLSEKIKGDKNPAYQHGGKFSPYSPNFTGYINRTADYGIDDVIKKQKKTVKENPQNQSIRIEYWLEKGLSQEDAKIALSERQTTFSLDKCIKKYGDKEGLRIWQERQEKWQNTLNSKPQEEINRINKLKVLSGNHISKNELEIFNYLKPMFENLESQLVLRNENGHRIFDMCIGNKIIEYNGDYWHCNPKIYSADFVNKRLKKSSSELWAKDQYKVEMANKLGYEVYTIWEKDYNNNKQQTLKECVNYLNQ